MKIYISVDTEAKGESIEDNRKLMLFLKEQGHMILRAPYVLSEDPDKYLKQKFGIEKTDFVAQRDIHLKWIDKADLVIADVSTASEGRAMMLQHAMDRSKKIIILNKNRKTFGRVMRGLIKSNGVLYYKYVSIDEVIDNWSKLLSKTFKNTTFG